MQLFVAVVAALAVSVGSLSPVHAANFCDLIRCTKEIAPVCGSNGVTYDNACMFQIAKCNDEKLSITATGKCEATAPTPAATVATIAPTPSPANATASPTPSPRPSTTSVPIAKCEMMCIDMYKPVCGSDGVTYTNQCQLQLADCNLGHISPSSSITVASEGKCPGAGGADGAVTEGPTTGRPRNSTDATATPTSEPSAANDDDVTAGPAPTPSEPIALCEMLCPMNYQPVCGSDGNTYSNSCELSRASCNSRAKLTQIAEGECADGGASTPLTATPSPSEPMAKPANVTTAPTPASTPRQCPQMCTEEYSPVCGSDGKTYANKCRFNIAKCASGVTTMAITAEGACAASEAAATPAPTTAAPSSGSVAGSCKRACPRIYRPVCGSDGVTYSNKCGFDVAKCTKRITTMSFVDGECSAPPE